MAQTTCPAQSEFTSEPEGRATHTQLLLQKEQHKVMAPSWNQEENTPGKNHHMPGDLAGKSRGVELPYSLPAGEM